jgi:hypothetical protein
MDRTNEENSWSSQILAPKEDRLFCTHVYQITQATAGKSLLLHTDPEDKRKDCSTVTSMQSRLH